MSKYYNQDDDENFGAEMLQNALAEAKKQSTLDEALAVLDSAMAAFRENTEALDQVARTQKTFATDSAPFMETAQKLIVLLEGLSNDKIPKKAVEVINSNIKTLCEVLGKYVNSKIEESDKAFYKSLEERDKAFNAALEARDKAQKKQLIDNNSVLVSWNVIYLLLTLFLGLTTFAAIIIAKNIMEWDNYQIHMICLWTVGIPLLIMLVVGVVKIYRLFGI